jgi:hypothetical protein
MFCFLISTVWSYAHFFGVRKENQLKQKKKEEEEKAKAVRRVLVSISALR